MEENLIGLPATVEPDTFRCGICHFEVNDLETFLQHKSECFVEEAHFIDEQFDEDLNIEVIETPMNQILDHLTCPHCFKRFKKTYNLKQHLLIHSNQRSFKCDLCGKDFVQKSNFKKHLKVHATQEKKNEKSQESISFEVLTKAGKKLAIAPVKMIKCDLCEFQTDSQVKLKSHRLIHQDSDIFQCYECSANFASEKNLDIHISRCHSLEKSFQCSNCSKSFSTQEYLKKHFLTHNPDSDYQCEHCDKKFKRSDNLKRHMKIHSTDSKIHPCPFKKFSGCKREFKRYDKLKDHLKTHGNVKYVNCDHCQELFLDIEELNNHVSAVHEQNEDDQEILYILVNDE